MIIAILIISCITLIAVCIGLFLNLKANRNTLTIITNFGETTIAKIENLRSEVFSKIEDFNSSTHSNIDITRTAIQTTVKDNSKFMQEELLSKAKESDVNNFNAIESGKKAILESLEPKISELKIEINQYFQKLSTDINSKVDTALQTQEKQQTGLISEVQNKFNKIIEEIKSPLNLD